VEIVNLVGNTVADSFYRLKFAHLRIRSMITNKGLLINLCLRYLLGRCKILQCPNSPGETRTCKKLWNRYLRLTCHIYSCLFLLTSSHPCTTTVYYRTNTSLQKAVIEKKTAIAQLLQHARSIRNSVELRLKPVPPTLISRPILPK